VTQSVVPKNGYRSGQLTDIAHLFFYGHELGLEGCKAQILILQVLRGREKGAVEAAFKSGAGIVFPSHHDPFFPGQKVPDLNKVRSLLERNEGVHFIESEAGKWYEIDTAVREA